MGPVSRITIVAAAGCLSLLGGGGAEAQTHAGLDPVVRHVDVTGAWTSTALGTLKSAEYDVTWQEETTLKGLDGSFQAPNRAQGFRTYFTASGVRVVPRHERDPSWEWGLQLVAVGGRAASAGDLVPERNRLEVRRGNVVEWYLNDERGLEQGFTVFEAPTGPGLLVQLEVLGTLEGALAADRQCIDFRNAAGAAVVRYDKLLVTDATGRELPARFALAGSLLSIEVDDEGAVYPVVVDPVASTPVFSDEGDQIDPEFGIAVYTAGDVNNDGYSDIIVGARQYDAGQADEGKAFVYFGNPTGLSVAPNWSVESNQAGAALGASVCTAGDLDHDGCDEIVVGAPSFFIAGGGEGRAFCYRGTPAGPMTTADWIGQVTAPQALFGTCVATAGDVDGDGFGDVVIGAEAADLSRGAVYLYCGSDVGLPVAADTTISGTQVSAKLGSGVNCAGDVNGDGYDDLIIGEPRYDAASKIDAGRVHVHHGSPIGVGAFPARTLTGTQQNGRFGESVNCAGDVNGDGFGDIVIGEKQYTGTKTGEGRVLVYFGSVTGIGAASSWTMTGGQAGANFGHAVSSAGDTNGDGYDDILIGAPFLTNGQNFEGRAYVFQGSPLGPESAPVWTFEADKNTAWVGFAVGPAGDVNRDFFDDIIVGATNYTGEEMFEGKVFAFLGQPDLPNFSDLAVDSAAPVAANAIEGEPPPAGVTRFVSNVGGANSKLSWAFIETPVAPWLNLAPRESAGLTPNAPPQAVDFNFDTFGLAPGTYQTVVRLLNIFHPTDMEEIAVTLTVTSHPSALCLDSTNVITRTTFLQNPSPAPEAIELSNCGPAGSLLDWQVTELTPVPWLAQNPSSGTALASGFSTPVTVAFDSTGMSVGTYTTTLRFQNLKKPVDFIDVPVELKVEFVKPVACLDVGQPIHIEHKMGSPAPAPIAREVKNCGAIQTKLGWSVTELPATSWLSVSPTSGADIVANEGTPITITINPAGLGEGSFGATLAFQNLADPSNTVYLPVTIDVIVPPGDLCIQGATALSIDHRLGDPDPAPLAVAVGNCGPQGSKLDWFATVVPSVAWLDVSPAGGVDVAAGATDPALLELGLDGLGVGTHVAVIRFSNVADTTDFTHVVLTVEVLEPLPDLDIDPKGTLVVNYVIGKPTPANVVLNVKNTGNAASLLPFAVVCESGGGWLHFTPGSGVVSGQQSAPITLSFIPDGLTDGTYTTVLRAENVEDHTDNEVLTVKLVVGNPEFDPGDRLLGVIQPDDFENPSEIDFEAVEGMKLQLNFLGVSQKLRTLVSIIDPTGKIARSFFVKYSGDEADDILKTVKIKKSGRYTLRVLGSKGNGGPYEIETSRKLPKDAGMHEVVLKKGQDGTATVHCLALNGAKLELRATHTAATASTQIGVTNATMPSGGALDTDPFEKPLPSGGLMIDKVPLGESGNYVLKLSGFGAGNDKLHVVVDPKQPPPGDKTVQMP